MVRLLSSLENHRNRTEIWTNRLNDMKNMELPSSLKTNANINKPYTRFTEFTKEWIYGVLSHDKNKSGIISSSEPFEERLFHNYLAPNWWKLAIKHSNGAVIENGLPPARFFTRFDRDEVYERFMPAYRAIKERFDERPIWHWFTQHAQYTAERDSLKAIKGIMMSLTGRTPEQFDNAYDNYCDLVPLEIEEAPIPEKEIKPVNKISIANEVAKELNEITTKKEPAITDPNIDKKAEKIK